MSAIDNSNFNDFSAALSGGSTSERESLRAKPYNGARRRTHPRHHTAGHSFVSPSSSEGSVDSVSIPSLHGSLLRVQKDRDPLRFYEVLKVLGDGSMGSVSKVQKRESALGGSARQHFVKREQRHNRCFGLFDLEGCLSFCPIFKKEEGPLSNVWVIPDSLRRSDNAATSSTGTSSSEIKANQTMKTIHETLEHEDKDLSKNAKVARYAKHRSSSLITYDHKAVTYALKSIHLDQCRDEILRQELLNEIYILQGLDHPNIVKPIETFDFRDRLYLVLELCSGGDLYSRDPYDETQACRIVHAVLDAVAYMHSRGITHRDLKFENIMFSSPNSDNVKVIDFGLSKKYSQAEQLHETVGTVYTMAPEVLKGVYDNKCDVWSMGIIAFMLLSSSLPFYGKTRKHVVRKILQGKYGFKGHRWKSVSGSAKEFVMECLVQKPARRKSAAEMLNHAFIKRDADAEKAQISFVEMDRVQATIETFCDYARLKKLALLVVAHKSTEEQIGFLQKVFNCFDLVRDGEIALHEFKEALEVYHYPDDELERMFNGMDLDGVGKVHYSEFLAATIESHGAISEERLAEAFDRLDSDDSGYITAENISSFLGDSISDEFVKLIIDEADMLQDNRISYEEFLALWNEGSDDKLSENFKSVAQRRASSDDLSVDSDDDATALSGDSTDGFSLDSSELSRGHAFFGIEKEKSTRGVWI